MALSPEEEIEDLDEDAEDIIEPSTTYRIDFESGRLTNEKINGLDAIRQFVYMALRTERYSHAVYSHDVGCEFKKLCLMKNQRTNTRRWRSRVS